MSRDDIDFEHLEVTGTRPAFRPQPAVTIDDAIIVVNQAYGPTGAQLVGLRDVEFDGFPALTLLVRTPTGEGEVHLSPIHGDRRKAGYIDILPGTKCELLCPVSKKPLEKIGLVIEGGEAEYRAVYLTEKLEEGSMIYISDVWGHHHSRIVDNNELISAWAVSEDGDS